jgi:hypothetical protein
MKILSFKEEKQKDKKTEENFRKKRRVKRRK